MSATTYRQAIIRGLTDAMAADDDVFLLGEDVGVAGGAFKLTEGLFARFGPERVFDTPISEQAIVGAAIGAAASGLRPVAEIMFGDFAAVCFDQIVNQLAKYRYMTNGQVTVPVTIRMANGAGAGFGSQHSQPVENWFLNVPGLKICVPGTPADMYGLLRAAIEDPDPVLVFEHKHLFNLKGELPDTPALVTIGQAEIVRPGRDITLVAIQSMRHRAVQAAEILASDGIEVEVIDPRTLAPLDLPTIFASVDRTNRLIVVQEATNSGSWGATVVAEVMAARFESLDAPAVIIGGDDTPIPYARPMEDAWIPSIERIAASVRETIAY